EMRYSHGAIQRARSYPQCYLWMLQYQGPASLLEYVADCYDAIADIAPLLSLVPCSFHRPRWAEDLLEIAARIQSALYHALREAGLDVRRYPDPDQDAVFVWLKWYTRTFQKFIPRHMRLEDPADYTQIQCIIEQLDEIQQSIPPAVPSAEEQPDSVPSSRVLGIEAKKHLRTLRYHVSHILRGSLNHEYHWRRIGEEIARLLGLGVPPSNVELRSILLPVVDDMPTDDVFLTQPVQLVLREIDRYLAQQEILEQLEDELFPSSREVCSVRTVLEGKTVVLIGGEKRSHRCQAIENAFGLRQLLWVATRPHESLDDIVPFVKRDDVALVLLAIRWSSHSYTALADVCKWYGKPFVRLPGGYNPNQIAAQILTQAATALGLKAPAAGLEPATL
ncbi:MAG: hypothetical protein N2663_01645, partial [Chlorobi bacterium]|nr:hypothetical protein [Chlorobiota bacterium]